MHSVQRRDTARSSIEQRLSSFTNEIQYDDTYQGDRVKGAARRDRNGDGNGSNEVDTDVEKGTKGILKTISLEVMNAKRQG